MDAFKGAVATELACPTTPGFLSSWAAQLRTEVGFGPGTRLNPKKDLVCSAADAGRMLDVAQQAVVKDVTKDFTYLSSE